MTTLPYTSYEAGLGEELCLILSELILGRGVDGFGAIIIEPIGNNGGIQFSNDTFALRDFCWCEGDIHGFTDATEHNEYGIPACPPNFEHFATGITARWYKRLGRSTTFSHKIDSLTGLAVLNDCATSLGITRTQLNNRLTAISATR